MPIKRVSVGDMFGWIGSSFRMVFGNPGTMFGAGFLMLVAVVLMMLPGMLVISPWMAMAPTTGAVPDMSQLLPRLGIFYGLILILNLVLMPPLIIGWMRLMRGVDMQQGPGPTTIFHSFSDTPAWLAGIRLSLLTIVLGVVLVVAFVALFWSSGSAFFAQVAQAQAAQSAGLPAPAGGFPTGLVIGYFLFLLAAGFLQFAYFLAMTELALRGGSASAALSAGLRAVLVNLLGLLLWVLILAVLGFVVALLLGLLLGLVMAALAAISPNLMMVGMIALYVPFLLLMYPLMHAGTYAAWKDMLGGDSASSTAQGEVAA